MKLVATLRSTETKSIEIETADYTEGRNELEKLVPEGWQMQYVRRAD